MSFEQKKIVWKDSKENENRNMEIFSIFPKAKLLQ